MHTTEEQMLCRIKEAVLCLGVRDRIETPDAYDLLDGIARAVVCVRVCAQNTAEIRLQPMFLGCFQLVAALIDTVALYCARDLHLNTHVQSRKGVIAACSISLVLLHVSEHSFTSKDQKQSCSACRWGSM